MRNTLNSEICAVQAMSIEWLWEKKLPVRASEQTRARYWGEAGCVPRISTSTTTDTKSVYYLLSVSFSEDFRPFDPRLDPSSLVALLQQPQLGAD